MIAQYFIKVVIPLVFSTLLAGFGWFAHEEIGSVVAGISGLVVSAIWTCYSWITGTSQAGRAEIDPRRIVVLAKSRRGKSGFRKAAYKLKLEG